MIDRALEADVLASLRHFPAVGLLGSRQTGKTTLAKVKLRLEGTTDLYYLWDLRSVRDRYRAGELFFTQDVPPVKGKKLWVCFDEIHKVQGWKNILKGIFDATQEHYQFIVTGSSKLNVLRKAGDSLSGRYFTFHLFHHIVRNFQFSQNLVGPAVEIRASCFKDFFFFCDFSEFIYQL